MYQGNAALQWVIDTEDDYLSDAFDDDLLFEDPQQETAGEMSVAERRAALTPAWLTNEFDYDMEAFED